MNTTTFRKRVKAIAKSNKPLVSSAKKVPADKLK